MNVTLTLTAAQVADIRYALVMTANSSELPETAHALLDTYDAVVAAEHATADAVALQHWQQYAAR